MEPRLPIPRTISVLRAGAEDGIEDAAVADAAAAFASRAHVPSGMPIVVFLDQSALPFAEAYACTCDWRVVMDAIATLKVRGAPAIGIAGYAALMLRAYEYCFAQADAPEADEAAFDRVFVLTDQPIDAEMALCGLAQTARMVDGTRPTAVALRHALDDALAVASSELERTGSVLDVADALYDLLCARIEQDEATNRAIGRAGAVLLPDEASILTHCNAGSLATAYYGTALGVVYAAASEGKVARVFADETRPVCQGSRLTAWELARAGIPTTLLCDSMAASVMAEGRIDAVIVGADRIAANGDVANKIGTLSVAINARYFGIPFYVAAPFLTIDGSLPDGSSIPIEQRDPAEVWDEPIEGVETHNPSFDVTPASLVTAIITERGIFHPGSFDAPLADASLLRVRKGRAS